MLRGARASKACPGTRDGRAAQRAGAGPDPGCTSLPEQATEGEPARLRTSHKMAPKWQRLPKQTNKKPARVCFGCLDRRGDSLQNAQ